MKESKSDSTKFDLIDFRSAISSRDAKPKNPSRISLHGPDPLPDDRRRSASVIATLTASEKSWVKETALQEGISASDYLRKLVRREMPG